MLEYAQGVINVLEKDIFDKLDQERMINSSNREEAFKVLFDTDMAEIAAKEDKLENILEQDMQNLKDILSGMLKETQPELFCFLFLKFDALNLKIILKERSDIFFSYSLVPFNRMKLSLEGKANLQNEHVEELVKASLSNKGSVDERVDKAYLESKLKIAKKIKGFPLRITKFEIDVINLKNMIKEKKDFLKGGNLSRSDLLKVLGKKKGMISRGLERFLEAFDLSLIINRFQANKDESELEKGLERFLAETVLRKEREGGGMEKVMGFFFRKVNSHSNIRLIFFQKDSGIPIEEIKNNLLPI